MKFQHEMTNVREESLKTQRPEQKPNEDRTETPDEVTKDKNREVDFETVKITRLFLLCWRNRIGVHQRYGILRIMAEMVREIAKLNVVEDELMSSTSGSIDIRTPYYGRNPWS